MARLLLLPLVLVGALCLQLAIGAAAAASNAAPTPKTLSFSAWLTQQRAADKPKAALASAAKHKRYDTEHVCFVETSQHDCRGIGDFYEGSVPDYAPGSYITSDIACCKGKDEYSSKGDTDWTASLVGNDIGSCSWSIMWFVHNIYGLSSTNYNGIYLNDNLYKLGTASATCTLQANSDDCGPFCSQTTVDLKGEIYAAVTSTSVYFASNSDGAPNWDYDCYGMWRYAPPYFFDYDYFPLPEANLAKNATRRARRPDAPPRTPVHRKPRASMIKHMRAKKASVDGRLGKRNNAKGARKAADAAASLASAAKPQDYHNYNDINIVTPPQYQAWAFVIAGQVHEPIGPVDTGIEGGTFDFPIYTYNYLQSTDADFVPGTFPTITPGTYNLHLWKEPEEHYYKGEERDAA